MLTHVGSTARKSDAVQDRRPSAGTPKKAVTFIHSSGNSENCASSAGGLGLAATPDGRFASAAAAAASTATEHIPSSTSVAAACSSSFVMCVDGSRDSCCPEFDAACVGAPWSSPGVEILLSSPECCVLSAMMAESVSSIVVLFYSSVRMVRSESLTTRLTWVRVRRVFGLVY